MAIFRNPFGYHPDGYVNEASGGLTALLQQAIQQQRLKQKGETSSLLDDRPGWLPAGTSNSSSLFAQLLASQSYLGSRPTGDSAPTSSTPSDPSFRQLSRLPSSEPSIQLAALNKSMLRPNRSSLTFGGDDSPVPQAPGSGGGGLGITRPLFASTACHHTGAAGRSSRTALFRLRHSCTKNEREPH